MQMIDNIYDNVKTANKHIAYFSLGWRLQKCIPGFIENMIKGLILKEVVEGHGFKPEWIADPKEFKNEIQNYLEEQVEYPQIKARDLTDKEWEKTRKIGTNLTPLSATELECLIRQAENLTEIQLKLYCPTLLHSHVHQ